MYHAHTASRMICWSFFTRLRTDRSTCLSPMSMMIPEMMLGSIFSSNASVCPGLKIFLRPVWISSVSVRERPSAVVITALICPFWSETMSENLSKIFWNSPARLFSTTMSTNLFVISDAPILLRTAFKPVNLVSVGMLGSDTNALNSLLSAIKVWSCASSFCTLSSWLPFTAAIYSAAAYLPGMPYCGGNFTSFSAACATPRAPCKNNQVKNESLDSF